MHMQSDHRVHGLSLSRLGAGALWNGLSRPRRPGPGLARGPASLPAAPRAAQGFVEFTVRFYVWFEIE